MQLPYRRCCYTTNVHYCTTLDYTDVIAFFFTTIRVHQGSLIETMPALLIVGSIRDDTLMLTPSDSSQWSTSFYFD